MGSVARETLLALVSVVTLGSTHILQSVTHISTSIHVELGTIMSVLALRLMRISVAKLTTGVLSGSLSPSNNGWTTLRSRSTLIEACTDAREFLTKLKNTLIVLSPIGCLECTVLSCVTTLHHLVR